MSVPSAPMRCFGRATMLGVSFDIFLQRFDDEESDGAAVTALLRPLTVHEELDGRFRRVATAQIRDLVAMADDDDWRLQGQEEHLAGVTLRLRRWTSEQQGWDHDHCEFCWKKIWDRASGDDESETAYATEDNYRWICEECVADFQERFGWTLLP
ncbi:MAG: hypothetical protein QOE09_3668 [Ilumatobacteraceae bacterium]